MENKKMVWLSSIVFVIILHVSCNKKFDEPPLVQEPTPNATIAQLKALHTVGEFEQITGDTIITGIVVADDRSGNYFRSIVIQDETGGILVRLDQTSLFTSYPIGRKVYVKCKGLFLGDYNGLMQLGGGVDDADARPSLTYIASNLIDRYIVKGSLNNIVTPRVVTIADLTTSFNNQYQNTLIQLNDLQFNISDTSKTYADAITKATRNFLLKECSNQSGITLRTSGYSNFAGVNVPNGNGSIVGIYSVFGSTKQLNIRDTADVQFNNERCDTGGGNTGNGVLTSISSIRDMYAGSGVKLGDFKISGVVISDATNKNISRSTIVLQDGSAGISIFIPSSNAPYNIGDSIEIDVSKDSLIKYNGQMEIKKSSNEVWPDAIATGITILPKELTIKQLVDSLPYLEFTLVKIKDASITGEGTFSGNKTLSDASGSITLYTSSAATFAGSALPSGTHDWIGYATYYKATKEFIIRNLEDIQ